MTSLFSPNKIAYFSMEIGVSNDIHTYSGGLGVLAGDTIRSSADLSVPMVAVTLISRKGYLKQKLTEAGEQLEAPDEWNPQDYLKPVPQTVQVSLQKNQVNVHAWVYEHTSPIGGTVPIFFLDTDVDGNKTEDRRITDSLYGGDDLYRLKQEAVLGIGGTRLLQKLGYSISKYHMNEGHSALLTLELLGRFGMDSDRVRRHCIFTTHTPVEAAFDRFTYDLVEDVLGHEYQSQIIKDLAGQDKFNMTLLALNLSGYQNGVTKMHSKQSLKMFPHYNIHAITNGVHSGTWTSPSFHQLFDKYISGWDSEPGLLVRVDRVPNSELWSAHLQNKQALLGYVKEKTGETLDPNALTIGFARRATGYKRAKLIFSDLKRLREISKHTPIQLIFAGKAHLRDTNGKNLIKEIFWYKKELKNDIKVVYLENYDMNLAAKLTSGVDVWLNTPLPPMEASGTSGMKAAHNGVVNFSILDGWWIEGCIDGVTGWAIGPEPDQPVTEDERRRQELDDLFNKLRYIIAPKFYNDQDDWIKMMKNSIGKVAYYFNTDRMMRRYITDAYLS